MELFVETSSWVLNIVLGQLHLSYQVHSCFHKFPQLDGDGPKQNNLLCQLKNCEWMAHSFFFKERDAPATERLEAQLRANYWHFVSRLYFPFLEAALQPPGFGSNMEDNSEQLDLARQCINALIETTRSFHGLQGGRPATPSIFSIAHAHCDNLVVLAAAFQHPILNSAIDGQLLGTLFEKSIHLVRQHAMPGSSLRVCLRILESVEQTIFPAPVHGQTGLVMSEQQTFAGRF
jgi:hypothetical protein